LLRFEPKLWIGTGKSGFEGKWYSPSRFAENGFSVNTKGPIGSAFDSKRIEPQKIPSNPDLPMSIYTFG
jgi:hypothetical protein